MDHAGNTLKAVTKLTNNSGAKYDYYPSVAVTPDGHIGVMWTRRIYNSSYSQYNYNVYFAVLDGTGKIVLAPTNITNNAAFTNGNDLNARSYYQPQISATGDNHFVLAWEVDYRTSSGWTTKIEYAVQDATGSLVKAVTQLPASGLWDFHSANAASGNQTLFTWRNGWDIYYSVLDSVGEVVKTETNLTNGGLARWGSDAVRLSDGRIAIAWVTYDYATPAVDHFAFAILDDSYNLVAGPTSLYDPDALIRNTNLSITSDTNGHAILTWTDYDLQHNLYYALLDSNGSVITPPMIFLQSQGVGSSLSLNSLGNGNAPYAQNPPLANDDFNTPVSIADIPYTNTQDTTLATSTGDDPGAIACSLAPGLASVWYQYTPPTDASVYLDTLGSNYNTILAVWSGSRGSLLPVACNDNVPGSTQSVVRAGLTGGTTYYFEIAQYNGSATGPLSQDINALAGGGLTFHVIPISSLAMPANGSTLLNNRPIFDWSDLNNAINYTIQVSKSATTFAPLLANVTLVPSTYAPVKDLPTNQTLYWRVRAKYLTGYGPWSMVSVLHTANPPSVPTLVALANNALTNSTPMLDWSNSKVPAGAPAFDHYIVQVDNQADFSSPIINVPVAGPETNSNYLATLASNTKYYWHVQACNTSAQCSAWSAMRYFRTALPAPISLSSDGTLQNLRPRLTWNMPDYPVPAATGYTVQVSKNEKFTQIVLTATSTSLSYTPSVDLPRNLPLWWHVRANGLNGPSAWSAPGGIGTGNPPSIPVLLAPANNALVTTNPPVLDWSDSTVPLGAPAFDHYRIQVAGDVSFTNPGMDYTVTDSSYTHVNPYGAHAKFYWRVQACNTSSECSAWSKVRSFGTK
jgi:hypothetical protein